MRSQIGGLTQGVKNAQDGISMIQTFEGALTETDSILQRMKTLADQAANGTYQDDVDRDAIQLEFDQLNDELNQIADTDYNGVIVLNGGQMADGLKQVDGKFDYSLKAGQVKEANDAALAEAQKTAQAAIDKATTAFNKATADYNATGYDLIKNGNTTEYNTIDDNALTQTQMDNIWTAKVGNANTNTLKASGATKVTVTYKATVDNAGAVTWAVDSASSNATDSTQFTDTQLKNFATTQFAATNIAKGTNATGLGGFKLPAGVGTANVIFDESDIKTGDTVTLVFTNEKSPTQAPLNVGFDKESLKTTVDPVTGSFGASSVAIGALKDEDMNVNTKAILDALNDVTVKGIKTSTAATDFDKLQIDGRDLSTATTGAKVTLKDADGNDLVDENGNKLDIWVTADKAAGTIKISTVDGAAEGTEIATVTLGVADAATTKGTIEAGLAIENYDYDSSKASFGITAGSNNAQQTSAAGKAAVAAAKKALDDANAAYPNSIDDLTNNNVSKSDAYDQATAPLTYTDHIILQSGARSKDAVDFTFKYSSGGMGKLKANMNCSAREDGLNTASLSLRNAKDANAAIDQIDNAINKVSMVRATFGAVQNRLEHKIDNMNVTKENLTSAESRIRDTNIAEEMSNFTKNQILSQASQSMLAQANSLPQGALQLLG